MAGISWVLFLLFVIVCCYFTMYTTKSQRQLLYQLTCVSNAFSRHLPKSEHLCGYRWSTWRGASVQVLCGWPVDPRPSWGQQLFSHSNMTSCPSGFHQSPSNDRSSCCHDFALKYMYIRGHLNLGIFHKGISLKTSFDYDDCVYKSSRYCKCSLWVLQFRLRQRLQSRTMKEILDRQGWIFGWFYFLFTWYLWLVYIFELQLWAVSLTVLCFSSQPVVTSQLGTVNNVIQVKKTDFEVFDALMVDSQKCSDMSGEWLSLIRYRNVCKKNQLTQNFNM